MRLAVRFRGRTYRTSRPVGRRAPAQAEDARVRAHAALQELRRGNFAPEPGSPSAVRGGRRAL